MDPVLAILAASLGANVTIAAAFWLTYRGRELPPGRSGDQAPPRPAKSRAKRKPTSISDERAWLIEQEERDG